MAYTYERPDVRALDELEQLIGHLLEELAGWRRRSLRAEADLQDLRAHSGPSAGPELAQARQRVIDLETENQALRQRVDTARERVRALVGRLSFLEQGRETA